MQRGRSQKFLQDQSEDFKSFENSAGHMNFRKRHKSFSTRVRIDEKENQRLG